MVDNIKKTVGYTGHNISKDILYIRCAEDVDIDNWRAWVANISDTLEIDLDPDISYCDFCTF